MKPSGWPKGVRTCSFAMSHTKSGFPRDSRVWNPAGSFRTRWFGSSCNQCKPFFVP